MVPCVNHNLPGFWRPTTPCDACSRSLPVPEMRLECAENCNKIAEWYSHCQAAHLPSARARQLLARYLGSPGLFWQKKQT